MHTKYICPSSFGKSMFCHFTLPLSIISRPSESHKLNAKRKGPKKLWIECNAYGSEKWSWNYTASNEQTRFSCSSPRHCLNMESLQIDDQQTKLMQKTGYRKDRFDLIRNNLLYLMLALGIEDVHGPVDVMNGIPLNVATPLSSVKRCCTHRRTGYKWKLRRNKVDDTEISS